MYKSCTLFGREKNSMDTIRVTVSLAAVVIVIYNHNFWAIEE